MSGTTDIPASTHPFFAESTGDAPVLSFAKGEDEETDEGGLPAAMTIKGFAMNTAVAGNGWHFEHDGIAELKGKTAHFVRDHDTSITAVAGTVEFGPSERFDIEVVHREEDPKTGEVKEKKVKESAAKPSFTARLDSDFPAYEDVAKSILSQQKAGKVPNVSVFIYASDWGYEKSSDRFFLKGPYWVRHLGQVDVGGFSDEVGVGVYDAEFAQSEPHAVVEAALTFDAAGPQSGGKDFVPVTCSVRVANMEELTHRFCVENADKPELIERLGRLLGLDEGSSQEPYTDHDLSQHEGCKQSAGDSPMKTTTEPDNADGEQTLAEGAGEVEKGVTQATGEPTPSKADKADDKVDDAALDKRIEDRARRLFQEEMDRRDTEREARALADRRTSIANAYPGVDVAVLEGMTSMSALDAYEESLKAAKGATLRRDGLRTEQHRELPRPMEVWDSKQDVDDWNTWHAAAREQALGPKAAAADKANNVGIYDEVGA